MPNPSPVKTLSHSERLQMATELAGLAKELTAGYAAKVQELLATSMAYGYPTKGSTAERQPGHQTDERGEPVAPDSIPERLAVRPDPEAVRAHHLITLLRRTHQTVAGLHRDLAALSPDRPVRRCTRCGHPLDRDQIRCQQIDENGRQCGARETAARSCRICGEIQEAGQPLRQGRCNTCRSYHRRTGRERIATSRLALGDNVQVVEEANGDE